MSSEPDEAKTDLVAALLDVLYESDVDHSQQLVTEGLKKIEASNPESSRTGAESWMRSRWFVITIAAAVLLAVMAYVPTDLFRPSAKAAIGSSIEQAGKDVGRHYSLTASFVLDSGQTVTRQAELFVKGNESLAIQSSGIFGTPYWMGSRHGKAWVVPPVGPVITGSTENLISWVAEQKEIETPYLHIATILERMRDVYSLEVLPDETIELPGDSVVCQRITGVFTGEASPRKPDRIELWINSETRVAVKVVGTWKLDDGKSGRKRLTIWFKESLELASEFFTPEAHGGTGRRRIGFQGPAGQTSD